jgi:hypothetical protein
MTVNTHRMVAVAEWFTGSRKNPNAILLFVKSLQAFAFLKIVFLWQLVPEAQAWQDRAEMSSFRVKSILLPINIAVINMNLFFAAAVLVVILCVACRPNYVLNIVFCLFMSTLFFVRHPAINGSDYILTAFSFWCIPLNRPVGIRLQRTQWTQDGLFNTMVLILQFQLAFTYFISGWDKIWDPMWRSGEAFTYIAHIDTMTNPSATWLFSTATGNIMFSWITILFELLFIVLIWFRRTRVFVLCTGVIFHLFIWWALTLPDFSMIMILSYIIFVRDTDLQRVRTRLRPQLP